MLTHCKPCEGGVTPIIPNELPANWNLGEDKKIFGAFGYLKTIIKSWPL